MYVDYHKNVNYIMLPRNPLLYQHLTQVARRVLAVLLQPWWCSFPSLVVPAGGWIWLLTAPLPSSHQLGKTALKYSPSTCGMKGNSHCNI